MIKSNLTLWQDSLGDWWVLDVFRGWGPFTEEEARRKMAKVTQ